MEFLRDGSSAIYVFCCLAASEAADCSEIIPFWVNILFPKGLNKRDKVLKTIQIAYLLYTRIPYSDNII